MRQVNRLRTAVSARFPATAQVLASLAAAVLVSGCLLLSGCLFATDDKVAGGAQDFPNTVALGIAASSHISDNSEWNQFSAIPSALPSFQGADSLVVPPERLYARAKFGSGAGKASGSGGMGGLAKTAAAGSGTGAAALFDTTWFDLSDTATLKVGRLIHQVEAELKLTGDTITKGDTVTFKWDANADDGIPGNELLLEAKGTKLWKGSDRRESYRYENTDSAGGFDRGIFLQRLPAYLPAGFKFRFYIMVPGPDGDISTKADNRPVYYAFARIKTVAGSSPDTLESFDITDADGDGTLWAAGDSGIVDFRQKTPTPVSRPSVESVTQKLRAVLFKDESKTYAIAFRESRVEKDGKRVVFSVRGVRDGVDSTFAPGDTVNVTVHVEFPETARMVEKTSRFKVILGNAPKKFSDNQLLRYSLEAVWRKDLATTKLVFTPDRIVAASELSITGSLQLSVDFGGGRTGEAEGRFENKLIDVVLNDLRADGKRKKIHLIWDVSGTRLKQEAVE
ncbi:MAG: hypothetical protein ABIW76_14290 [Fibrobacteria bacterium]